MNKLKSDCKKQIVRYPEDAKPKTVVVPLPEDTANKKPDTPVAPPVKEISEAPKPAEIVEPKLNTALCIKKRIKEVEESKPRKIKSLSDLSKSNRITVDEKVTKKVNFPYDQRLYKKLISLQLVEKPPPQVTPVSHEPIIKDRIPKLEDFYVPTQKEEYSIPVNVVINSQPIIRQYNGFHLQQIVQSWHKDQPD